MHLLKTALPCHPVTADQFGSWKLLSKGPKQIHVIMMSCLNELNKRSADIQYFATKPTVGGLKFTNINNF